MAVQLVRRVDIVSSVDVDVEPAARRLRIRNRVQSAAAALVLTFDAGADAGGGETSEWLQDLRACIAEAVAPQRKPVWAPTILIDVGDRPAAGGAPTAGAAEAAAAAAAAGRAPVFAADMAPFASPVEVQFEMNRCVCAARSRMR